MAGASERDFQGSFCGMKGKHRTKTLIFSGFQPRWRDLEQRSAACYSTRVNNVRSSDVQPPPHEGCGRCSRPLNRG
ncbi:hypothetical protein PLUA15_560032 [Pseudomonas lundensis]|uniref:Uncharacterized protein n=1 Tax=Pseudomonas lundensis TaxID=86185 RepID=A0AAX2HFH7_9PSED|nr:hypothetical protein PLUA15_560032 [Pseudomonas lundensis]